MNISTKSRLIALNAKLSKTVDFANREEEESGIGKKLAIGAGIAGAGYAGASILRGRKWQERVLGAPVNTPSGVLGALKTGHRKNVVDAAKYATTGSAAVKQAANVVADKAIASGRSAKAALLIAQRRARGLLRK